eukprot:scaffold91822_cov21-Tisochrysis_lutea.AAC.1
MQACARIWAEKPRTTEQSCPLSIGRMQDRLPEFCPQDMTNLLWAFAQVGHPAPALFEACVPAISSMITGACLCAYMHACMHAPIWYAQYASCMFIPPVFAAVALPHTMRVNWLLPLLLSSHDWYVEPGLQPTPLLFPLHPSGFTPQGLANLAWAYTKAGLVSGHGQGMTLQPARP